MKISKMFRDVKSSSAGVVGGAGQGRNGKAHAGAIAPRWAVAVAEVLFADNRDALLLADAAERVIAANPEWPVLCGGAEPVIGASFAEVAGDSSACELADLLRRERCEGRPTEALVTLRHRRSFDLRLAALITPIAARDGAASAYRVRLRPPSLDSR